MSGLSLKQFGRLTQMGLGMDGRKILIRAPKHGIASLGESRAYYTIRIVTEDGYSAVELVPHSMGDVASSRMDNDLYAYTHGGSLFRAAVEAARELASALGWD